MSLTILVMVFTYPGHHHHQWYVHNAQCANSVAMPQSETPNLDLPPTQFWATDDHTIMDRDDGSDVDERMMDNIKYDDYQEHMSKHQSQGHSWLRCNKGTDDHTRVPNDQQGTLEIYFIYMRECCKQ